MGGVKGVWACPRSRAAGHVPPVTCHAGHLAGPVLCHSFCNSMGFPALGAALGHPRRRALLPCYALGVLLFLLLLLPLTEPGLFGAARGPPACS